METINKLKELDLILISVGKNNPRKTFDEDSLNELSESIKNKGVLQPILVRPDADGYELVCGERRLRASQMAGLTSIPANIRELSDDEAFEMQIIENLERKDVHPLEEAEAFKRMIDSGKYEIADISAKFAKSESFILQRLKIVDLLDELKEDFRKDKFGIGHAVIISRLSQEGQKEVYDDARRGWQVDEDDPDYGTINQLKSEIQDDNPLMEEAVFPLDKTNLVKDVCACDVCPKRTKSNPLLFSDMQDSDTCMDKKCYENKTTSFIEMELAKIINEGSDVPILASSYQKPSETLLTICKEFDVSFFIDYKDFNTYQREGWEQKKGFWISGSSEGEYQEIFMKPETSRVEAEGSENSNIQDEINKIEDRAKRAIELDNVKIFKAIKDDPKLYDEYPLSDADLTELEKKALWYLFKREVLDWQSIDNYNKSIDCPDSYNSIDEFNFYKATPLEELNLNMLVRTAIIDKLSQMHEPNFDKCTRSRFYFEIIKAQMPSSVNSIVAIQNEKSKKRISRTNEKLEKLKSQLEPANNSKDLKWNKVDKRYALNNSYFKNRAHDAPSTIIEVAEYLEEHNELPFDYDHNQGNWIYDSFVEKQKRDGVHLSQFFTPDQTAERISELAVDFFGEENNVLDACCGFGQLSKALIEKGFQVEGFDLSEDMIRLYKNLSDKTDVMDFGDYTELFECIVSNPPYEIKELTEFLECLKNQMLTDEGKAILLLPMGFVDKERPKKLVEVLEGFNILHREDMQEEFARTKIRAEIVVVEKVI